MDVRTLSHACPLHCTGAGRHRGGVSGVASALPLPLSLQPPSGLMSDLNRNEALSLDALAV